ncbi:hypothetical protein IFR05_003046 [Cadophora sp. M221]|nr:hypothetical protein IFR05_003046 [Cadophora sp. M221]
MTRTDPADEVPKKTWILDGNGRWTLNPAVVQVTTEVKHCLTTLEKFDAGWESFGLKTIQKFYDFMGTKNHLEDADGNVFRFDPPAFNMPKPTSFSRALHLRFSGRVNQHGLSSKLRNDKLSSRKFIRMCVLSLRYFRLWPNKTQAAAELDSDSQKPANVLSSLPVDLQMEILENLSLAEMDRSIRSSFQDLTHLHLATLKFRSKRFFMDLCSRENFTYGGTWYNRRSKEIHEVYRLKYPNLHPNLRPRRYRDESRRRPIAETYEPPSLSWASFLLMNFFQHLAWQRGHPDFMILEHNKVWRTNKRFRALAFSLDPEDLSKANMQPPSNEKRTKRTLLIYQDELNLILDNLDPYFRPTFLAHQMVGLDPNITNAVDYRYIFPHLDWSEYKIERNFLVRNIVGRRILEYGHTHCTKLWHPKTTVGIEQSSYDADKAVSWWEADRIKQLSVMVIRLKL